MVVFKNIEDNIGREMKKPRKRNNLQSATELISLIEKYSTIVNNVPKIEELCEM